MLRVEIPMELSRWYEACEGACLRTNLHLPESRGSAAAAKH
jgi:hypothetical protein